MQATNKKEKGVILVYLIIFTAIFGIIIAALVANFIAKLQYLRTIVEREQAFQIAEAGLNYFQWHLIQFPEDYQDDDNLVDCADGSGVLCHNYLDYDTQQNVGQFKLSVTAPGMGGTAVVVQSAGWLNSKPSIKRTVTATFAFPSLAKYSLLTDKWMYGWSTETYNGPLHSNGGIRFEGLTDSSVTSAVQTTYTSDCNQEYPQAKCPTTNTRDAIWALGANKSLTQTYWNNPVTRADFQGISSSFSNIQAQSLLGQNLNLPLSTKYGYSIVFNSDGTVSVYKVLVLMYYGSKFPVLKPISDGSDTSLNFITGGTDYVSGICTKANCSGCINMGRCLVVDRKPIPAEGLIIYAQENLWVEGTVNGRVVVATANGQPNTNPNYTGTTTNLMPNIYISNNIRYADAVLSNGSYSAPENDSNADTLGLMAEGNIVITKNAPDPLYVHAALLAQRGFIAAPICYYAGSAKTNAEFLGSLILNGSWWFNFTNYCGSYFTDGYSNPRFKWDRNLLYYPPPYFPRSSVSATLEMVRWSSD